MEMFVHFKNMSGSTQKTEMIFTQNSYHLHGGYL